MRTMKLALGGPALISVLSMCFAGCGLDSLFGGGGGGGGGLPPASNLTVLEREPNDGGTFPSALLPGQPVRGDLLLADDVDWFNVRLIAGSTVRIEVWATRLDQPNWDASGTAPHVTVYFPTIETKLLEQSFTAGWTFGTLDFEVPAFRLPLTGPFFWIKLESDTPGVPGGRYVLRVSYVSVGPGQAEDEADGDVGGNDTTGTAEPIFPGIVNGFHRDANDDFYSLTVGGLSLIHI